MTRRLARERSPSDCRPLIAHLGPDPRGPGGMPAVVRGLVESPLADRYRMDVIATYRTARPLRRLVVFLISLAALVRWCLGPGTRIVHIHSAVRGSLYRKSVCVAVAKALRRPVILHVHAGMGDIAAFHDGIGPVRRALFRRAFALPDRVLSVSAAGADEVGRRFHASRIAVIPHAAPQIPPSPPSRSDSSHLQIVYAGGFADPAKGGVGLVEALPDIMAVCPMAEVTLAGPGKPPAGARKVVDALDRVRWAGWLEGESKAYAFGTADVFLVPSLSEGLPVALLEAMAYGRPIIATRVGGIPEALTHDIDALLIPPGDGPALAEAVRALAQDPERRHRLGLAARERAAAFDEDNVCRRLDALYRELASEGGRVARESRDRGQVP